MQLSDALNVVLADMFGLYMKTKNFHWHMSGPHFRDYHLLLDEQSQQIFAVTDAIAGRVRKIGGLTLHSIGEIRLAGCSACSTMRRQLRVVFAPFGEHVQWRLGETHGLCDECSNVATVSMLEIWIDESERRAWFVFETARPAETATQR